MKLAMALQHANQQGRLSLNSQTNQHHHQQHLNRLALASSMINNSGLSENEIAVLQPGRTAISPTLSARLAAARQRGLSLEMMNNDSDSSMGILARMAADPNRPGSGHESNQR